MGISPRQLEELQQRLTRKGRVDQPPVPRASGRGGDPQVLLGIDPSLRGTGYGVVRAWKNECEALEHGTLKCPASWPQTRCLARIASGIKEIIQRHSPVVCIVEGLFHAQNIKTALIMGQARGAGLAMVAQSGIEIFEMAPRKVKQAIVGYGAAGKDAVARMVQRRLNLAEVPGPDAADALALAIAFAQISGSMGAVLPKSI